MTPEKWARIKGVYEAADALAPEERDAYLGEACGEDEEIRGAVLELLAGAATVTEAVRPQRALREGDVLCGRYRIERRLGRGGMGDVFAAMDNELGERIAIKTVVEEKVDEDAFERLRRELRLTRRLTHPNLCRVHDIARDMNATGSVLFFTMELLEGETLHERIRRDGPMGEDEALVLLRQMAGALEAAHDAGVIHRDLKPANVMLVAGEDGARRAVVMDFGIARTTGSGAGPAPFATMTGNLIGTPAYMAPEQLEGTAATPATDVYSLGLILYEMLTGRRAFGNGNTLAEALKRLHLEPERPSAHIADLSAGWERAILRCLAREPEARFARASEIVTAVEAGRRRKARPVKWGKLGLLAGAACLVAGLGWLWWRGAVAGEVAGRRMAVVPFVGKNGVDEYLAAGFAGSIGDRMAAAARGSGIAWVTPAEMEQQGARGLAEARQKLGVTEVVGGELQERGKGYAAVMTVYRAADGASVARYELEGAKLDELAGAAAARLRQKYGLREAGAAAGARTRPALVLRGLGLLGTDVGRAVATFEESLRTEGETVEGYLGLARASRMQLQRTKDGAWVGRTVAALDAADRMAPGDVRGQVERAELYLAERKPAAALERLEAARLAGGESADLELAVATAYTQMGVLDKAEEAYRAAIRMNGQLWTAYNRFAVFFASRGRYEEAAEQFRGALRIAPDNARVLSNLGGVMLQLGRYEESQRYLEKAVKLEPRVGVLINLGGVNMKRREWAAAAGWYEKALEKDQSDHKIWESLAKAYERLPGQKERSRDAFGRAEREARKRLEKTPKEPELLADLAAYQAFTGTRRDALETIQRALALGPSNVNVMMAAAEVYEALGFRTEALDWVKRAMERGFPRKAVEESLGLEELRKDGRFGG